jgi:hypothetical protein
MRRMRVAVAQKWFVAEANCRNREPHLHLLATALNFFPQIKQVTMYPWLQ